jgi:poly-beta-1,6-N-acetyl-D-glucosamine biosynthesis protein PgaD
MKTETPPKRPWQLVLEVAATTVFWAVWLYVVTPLVSALLWLAGIHVFVEQMIVLGGYEALIEKLTTYGLVVFVMLVVISTWVTWNVRRYGRHNTRTHQLAAVTLHESASAAGLPAKRLEQLRTQRRLLLDYDDQDRLTVEESRNRRLKR